jgi:uncharacterized protein YciI
MDYLVIMRMGDPKDPELQRLRAEHRDAHLARASGYRERGHLVIGGALMDEAGKPTGSMAVARFETRKDLDDWLAGDPWTQHGVYSDIEIIPLRIADHYPQSTG